MTDGTSQGLFIVVAIVIFGIFTLMAYILFEDTLSPALANMFSEATEQADHNLNSNKGKINANNLGSVTYAGYEDGLTILQKNSNSITFSANSGTIYAGVYLPYTMLEPSTKYELSYDITLLDGEVYRLGGHLVHVLNQEVYVDGVRADSLGTYGQGFEYNLVKNRTYRVKVLFEKDNGILNANDNLYIQPNREIINDKGLENTFLTDYKVRVENIYLKEIK